MGERVERMMRYLDMSMEYHLAEHYARAAGFSLDGPDPTPEEWERIAASPEGRRFMAYTERCMAREREADHERQARPADQAPR